MVTQEKEITFLEKGIAWVNSSGQLEDGEPTGIAFCPDGLCQFRDKRLYSRNYGAQSDYSWVVGYVTAPHNSPNNVDKSHEHSEHYQAMHSYCDRVKGYN
ncbi:hypothetical protein JN01_0302 [Entomoplasma freundtii]|uniref:Uncharacterized protein n=1 Tax=Entomoplasma freundtii TaxID=74700 RepID=A0A2K8NR76_9MOLU|nr:hypothetical protein [Entomoplasma freundtii]ATZ16284.1 hypothetical protein EFREU_v1c02580 [Entomoplasma freundtii]TDY56814.1 hypothetical protein JN01_0302 [Entomoplasma freundtii]